VVATVGRLWWRSHYFEETDNAYVEGQITMVAPRISGVVAKVFIVDNQQVKEGDRLVELDPADYAVRVERINARLRELDAELKRLDALIAQGRAEAQSVAAGASRARVQAAKSRVDANRQIALFAKEVKAVSKTELDAAVAARDTAEADVAAQDAQVKVAEAKIFASESARRAALARRDALAAELKDAELQRGYTLVRAPVSGRVGRKNVEVGAHVQPGQRLLALVQDDVWVVANFKEVQLRDLHPGQKASVRIDAFPGQDIAGRIDSFSPASGSQFALLPPDNATGNFTKIVQRVPVKVVFDPGALGSLGNMVVPGMSALVEVDLRQGKPPAPAR
jgi:membrane fusion protein (multidrug efflux system)